MIMNILILKSNRMIQIYTQLSKHIKVLVYILSGLHKQKKLYSNWKVFFRIC